MLTLQELTPRAQDSLVSFGERLSTRVFAAFLRSQGIAANQHDAFAIGMTTTDDFQNAEIIYNETLPALKAALTRPPGAPKSIPVVTGFLGRGINTGIFSFDISPAPDTQKPAIKVLSGPYHRLPLLGETLGSMLVRHGGLIPLHCRTLLVPGLFALNAKSSITMHC